MPSYQVPVSGSVVATADATAAIAVALYSREPERLLSQLATTTIGNASVVDDHITLQLSPGATFKRMAEDRDLTATFVVDFDEPPIEALASELTLEPTDPGLVAKLRAFVGNSMAPTSYGSSFDIASEVAKSRAGDCTEHAVLLTAIARAKRIPARTVIGVLLVSDADKTQAFGHAWSELLVDDKWSIADAAMPPMPGKQFRYLPVSLLSNEGMGFTIGILNTVGLMPGKITVGDET